MARRADAGRASGNAAGGIRYAVRVGGQVTDVRFVDEMDMVRKSMDSFPVDRMWVVTDYPGSHANLSQAFAVFLADHLVAVSAQLHRWHSCPGLGSNGTVAESAVHAQALHSLTRRVGVRA